MNWIHREINAHNDISLHDCRATRLSASDDQLEFTFDHGFTLIPNTRLNSDKETVDTGLSALAFIKPEAEINLHIEHRFFRRNLYTTRKSIALSTLEKKLNTGKWELEFIHEYYGYQSALFTCWIWQKRRPYHIECQIDIWYQNSEYCWNETL